MAIKFDPQKIEEQPNYFVNFARTADKS